MAAKDTGSAFLHEVLAKVPEDKRASVLDALSTSPEALELLGSGVLRQSDYSRQMDDLRTQKATVEDVQRAQAEWWKTAEPIAQLGEAAAKAGWKPGTPLPGGTPPVDPPADMVRKADLDERERNFVRYNAFTNKLAFTHLQRFNDPLDLEALIADATKANVTLDVAYQSKYGAKIAEQDAAKVTADIDRRVQEGVAAKLKEAGAGAHPSFPGKPPLGSPLDALEPVGAGPGDDALLAAYNEALSAGATS